ncbi:MAG: hypothetical protein NC122_01295 [Faecalibacterium sp.]|nr:hypothetical protein [Ruminococcus sp.]MCM1392683.1 hypothetical protein [Ruminococcus sp.]MCM1484824.1 hypothetical protein [Faecalibacterium sp.]
MTVAIVFTIITIVSFFFTALGTTIGWIFTYEFENLTDIQNFIVVYHLSIASGIFVLILVIMLIVLIKSDSDFFVTSRFVASFVIIAVVCSIIAAVPIVQSRGIAECENYYSENEPDKGEKYKAYLPYYDEVEKHDEESTEVEVHKYKSNEFTYNSYFVISFNEESSSYCKYLSTYYESDSLILKKLYQSDNIFDRDVDDYGWSEIENYAKNINDTENYKLYVCEYEDVFENSYNVIIEGSDYRYDAKFVYDEQNGDVDLNDFIKISVEQFKLLRQDNA